VANGRLPVKVEKAGIYHQETGVSMDATVANGGQGLPRTLQPGESLVAGVSMEDVARRLSPNHSFSLGPWAIEGSGRRRTGVRRTVRTPALPKLTSH
jgi:hypothetical protein